MPEHATHNDNVIEALIPRHRAFWELTPVDRPLLHKHVYQFIEPNQDVPLRDGRTTRDGTTIDPLQFDYQALIAQRPPPTGGTRGDFLHAAVPHGLCWTEGYMGANVQAATGSIWTEPRPWAWDQTESLAARVSDDNPWYTTLRDYVLTLADAAGGRVPVEQTLMRGPIDIIQAIAGSDSLALGLYDSPNEVRRALELCKDAFIHIGKLFSDLVPDWHGGRCIHGMWCPGTVIRLQSDHSVLMSPKAYREFCRPLDLEMAAAFDYSIFHLHSGCVHILDSLLDNPNLTGIQVTIDSWPSGPRLYEVMPRLAEIQKAGKCLEISGGPVSEAELDQLLSTFPATGLAVALGIGSTWD